MPADVHQSVGVEGTTSDVPGHAQGPQAAGPAATAPLHGAVWRERHALSQKMGASGAEAQLSLPLASQVPEEEGGVLIRVQREEAAVREADLCDL